MSYYRIKFLVIPFIWIRYYFFQRTRFEDDFPMTDHFEWKHLPLLARLVVPLFLVSLFIALVLRAIMQWPSLTAEPATFWIFCARVALGALLGTISGIAFGTIIGKAGVIPMGLVGGSTMDIPFGAAGGLNGFAVHNWPVLLLLPFLCSLLAGGYTIQVSKLGRTVGLQRGFHILIVMFLALGAASMIPLVAATLIPQTNFVQSVLIVFSDTILGLMLGFAADRHKKSIVWIGILLIVLRTPVLVIAGGITDLPDLVLNFLLRSGSVMLLSYLIIHEELLPYLEANISTFKVYMQSRRNPSDVFVYLNASILRQREHKCPRFSQSFLFLRRLLFMAAKQNAVATIEEIEFILKKYPTQKKVVWATALEVIMYDLEQRNTFDTIEPASEYLTKLSSSEPCLLEHHWIPIFENFRDVCRKAADYRSAGTKENGSDALQEMHLKLKMPFESIDDDEKHIERIERIISNWQQAIQQEQKQLAQASSKFGVIDNPYRMGSHFVSKDPLYVGRDELLRQLKDILEYNSNTFFLTGERRIGKTSTLMQLPEYLGTRYLTIVCNLQNTAIISSIAAFFNTLAEGIYEELDKRKLPAKRLDARVLRAISGEKAVYEYFEEWLNRVERTLQNYNRKLVFAFDEFENLKKADFNVEELLKWLRAAIAERPNSRIALLFCGLELNPQWKGYFLRVQPRKLSLLDRAKARELILQPTPNFPGQEVFNEGVVEEILRLSGCHPFLLRALCSEVIMHLNAHEQGQAMLEDIRAAADAVLSSWDYYFSDLWNRSDSDQQNCLHTLKDQDRANFTTIAKNLGRSDETVRETLKTLIRRDLVLKEDTTYTIAIPLVARWIEKNSP